LLPVEDALFDGLERWFMSSRKGYRQPGSHYCLSLSRGGAVSTVSLPPAGVWAVAAVALLAVAWSAAITLYVAFHDDVMGAILARQAEMKAAYEDRLAEARAQFDEATSRQLLERNSIKSKVDEVLSRQARLEQRGAIVVALAETEAHGPSQLARREAPSPSPPDALSAIQALGPPTAAGASAGADDAARAYAPLPEPGVAPRTVQPHPIDESEDTLSALPLGAPFTTASVKGAADNLAPSARLALVDRSLDQVEGAQAKALAAIDRAAERAASRDATIVAEAGLDPTKLSLQRVEGGVGGPYIPVDLNASGLDPALARVARDVTTAERLKALLSFVPLRMPLSGDPSLTSSFGYRVDPFLGRLALHPGLDLAEAYGAEIHAAAAGRVVRAGPAGGYGIMVEIDHGNGLATRYAHMSEALVEEGEAVDKGAVLGRLGSTGRSTGPHLHYEVRVDGEPVDPERYLRAGAELTSSE
jgi:murein DD-endopeptidase MepM/ murein hydrolase activator NlpD